MPDRAAGGTDWRLCGVARCLQGDLLGHCTDVVCVAGVRAATFGRNAPWEIAGNKTIVRYDIIELFARLPPQRCPRARNRQGHVAARWPTPPLTSLHAAGNQSQVGHHEIVASWSNKEMEKIEDQLDNNCLMQGLGFENPQSSQTGGDYCDRSLTAASAASFNPKTQENRGAHQAFWLSCKIGYLLTSNPADQSTASEFFTGD